MDKFDLEQKIMVLASITDDLEIIKKDPSPEAIDAVITLTSIRLDAALDVYNQVFKLGDYASDEQKARREAIFLAEDEDEPRTSDR